MATGLQLDYIFTPTPYPIRASAQRANANKIDLHVIISNPSRFDAVTMEEIQIALPVGDNIAADIAVSTVLDLTYDKSGLWSFTTGASGSPDGAVTIKPATGGTGDITTDAIEFTILGIVVNEQPGTALVKITETTPPARSVTDSSTYRLRKLDADFPVTSLTADPRVLDDLDKSTTLNWTVSDEGQSYRYGLRIVSIGAAEGTEAAQASGVDSLALGLGAPRNRAASAPVANLKDCATDDDCYSWQDGQQGVISPPISQTTTYALDIVTPPAAGKRYPSPSTTVQVTLPSFSPNSYFTPSPTGHLVSVHWRAFNVRACTVVVDQTTIDDNAPPDTYGSGYLVTIADEPTSRHDITVSGQPIAGHARASYTCQPQVTINQPTTIPAGQFPDSIVFTPDGTVALVANQTTSDITVIDMNKLTPEAATIPTGQCPVAITTTRDGSLALTADLYSDTVTIIDIAKRAAIGTVSVPQPTGVVVTSDGQKAFVTDQLNNRVVVIDIAAQAIEGTPIPTGTSSNGIVISTDGTIALTADIDVGTVTVIDVANRHVKCTIAVGTCPDDVAITPDGSHAVVANQMSNTVSLVDLTALKVVATFNSGPAPSSVAMSPDGSRALVCNYGGNDGGGSLSMIDIPNRTCALIPIDKQGDPPLISSACGAAFAPDGSLALISDGRLNQIIVL